METSNLRSGYVLENCLTLFIASSGIFCEIEVKFLLYRGLFLLGYLIGMVMEQGESTEDGARLPCRA